MMHKCEGCKYRGEHQEMGFRAVGVCNRETDVLKATMVYNSIKCPYRQDDESSQMAEDVIKRHEAIAIIHEEMKRSYLPARKNALKQAIDLLKKVPSVEVNTAKSSHWFNASGWWLCYNCGGRNEGWKTTPFCPHCGCPMDELLDMEIE